MGFRYQKRIKLGKGLGLNISKSGISPSYRSKSGSVGSKGYSVRTGTPGLTFRKSFSKSRKSGCLGMIIALCSLSFLFLIVGCDTHSSKAKKWYEGSNLHSSKIVEWKSATEHNKIATCSDFINNLEKNISLEEIKYKAINLKSCIEEAVKGYSTMDNSKVSEIAAMCHVLLNNKIK